MAAAVRAGYHHRHLPCTHHKRRHHPGRHHPGRRLKVHRLWDRHRLELGPVVPWGCLRWRLLRGAASCASSARGASAAIATSSIRTAVGRWGDPWGVQWVGLITRA